MALAALIHGLAPVARSDARVLVLGSMAGPASLRAQQYYAHPQNQFWAIMGAACGASPTLAYAERCARLQAGGIALWDVLRSCQRTGAADAAIALADAEANELPRFLSRHAQLASVLFNGALAERVWRLRIDPQLQAGPARQPPLRLLRLPSTCAANAGWSRSRRLAVWLAALRDAAPWDAASPAAVHNPSRA
jgi:hypoxanthine-DNA glycosylase